jgi:spore maturation protein CgeB
MRILFLETNPMWIYGLPNGFRDLGHTIKFVDPCKEEKLVEALEQFKPNLIFTIGWTAANDTTEKQFRIGHYVQPSGIPHVYWATEDPGYTEIFSLPLIKRTLPDMVFTICRDNVPLYNSLGIEADYLPFGYHSSVHFPSAQSNQYKSSVAMVANGYPQLFNKDPNHLRFASLKSLVNPVLEKNIPIFFYGRYWDDMQKIFDFTIPSEWIKGFLPYTEANKVYSSADVIIGVQNKMHQLTQRTYEILGSGGFLLTSDTPEIRKCFTPYYDLIVSSSNEETAELLQYYLNRSEERLKIRQNGSITVKNHTYSARAKTILKQLHDRKIIPWYID